MQARVHKTHGFVQATQVLAAIVRDYLLKHKDAILEEYAALQTKHVESLGRGDTHFRALSEAACASRAPVVPELSRKPRRGSLCGAYAVNRPL